MDEVYVAYKMLASAHIPPQKSVLFETKITIYFFSKLDKARYCFELPPE